MKKIIYGFLIAVASLTLFTGCTEEEVKPKSELESGGNGGIVIESVNKN
jgi:hypothetical protein